MIFSHVRILLLFSSLPFRKLMVEGNEKVPIVIYCLFLPFCARIIFCRERATSTPVTREKVTRVNS